MNFNPGQLLTYESLFPVLTSQTTSIDTVCFIIVGLYGEDDDTISETIQFIQKLQKIKYTFFDDIGVLAIYPGTEIYDIAKENGFISDEYWMTDKSVPLFTVEHSSDKLMEYKEIVRDHISLKRLKTIKGFKAQLPLVPYIILWRVKQRIEKTRRRLKRRSKFILSKISNW